MSSSLNAEALNQLFLEARTHVTWQDKDISDDLLVQLYDLAKWGPTGMNCCPMRLTFVKTSAAKEKLLTAVNGGNIEQTQNAPITVIVSMDDNFFVHMPWLFPSYPEAKDMYQESPETAKATADKNTMLQAGYLIMAARALGLDCGPMGGFDKGKVDQLFFNGTNNRSTLLINLGYGDASGLYPRGERFEFNDAAEIV